MSDDTWFEFSPWSFWRDADTAQRDRQLAYLDELGALGYEIGPDTYLASSAAHRFDSFRLGARSYVAAHCYLSGTVAFGVDCSLNPFSVVRGTVTIGDGTRIGAHTSILAFNHGMAPDEPVFHQPHTSVGIHIGDDVWIGSHVVVLDGVTIGSHAIVAAGAIVTRDVPEWSIVAGNPARIVGDRRTRGRAAGRSPVGRRLAEFSGRAAAEAVAIIEASWDGESYRDAPHARPTVRAHCDAIEIADLLLRDAPAQLSLDGHVRRLRGWQHEASGLVPELDRRDEPSFEDAAYHVLCVGYALDLLGAAFPYPIAAVTETDATALTRRLAALDWRDNAWAAGSLVDGHGTALLWTLRAGHKPGPGFVEALFGWLAVHADATTGLWGGRTAADRLLQPVNGFYRASRGTLAQFGLPVSHPRSVVDTVLRHASDVDIFGPGREDACNVLDIAHPLWLCRKQEPTYRRTEVVEVAHEHLERILGRWVPGRGLPFAAARARTRDPRQTEPGLQGTEMWLATLWLLADLLDESSALTYRPRGVHRPEPAMMLGELTSG